MSLTPNTHQGSRVHGEERGVSNNGRKRKRACRGLGLCRVLVLHPAQPGVGVLQQLLDALCVPLLKVELLPLHLGHCAVQLHQRQNPALSSLLQSRLICNSENMFPICLYLYSVLNNKRCERHKYPSKVTYKEHD